jgi:hypothetical protein
MEKILSTLFPPRAGKIVELSSLPENADPFNNPLQEDGVVRKMYDVKMTGIEKARVGIGID